VACVLLPYLRDAFAADACGERVFAGERRVLATGLDARGGSIMTAEGCPFSGYVLADDGKYLGCVEESGDWYLFDENVIHRVDGSGAVYDTAGACRGHFDGQDRYWDADGHLRGCLVRPHSLSRRAHRG